MASGGDHDSAQPFLGDHDNPMARQGAQGGNSDTAQVIQVISAIQNGNNRGGRTILTRGEHNAYLCRRLTMRRGLGQTFFGQMTPGLETEYWWSIGEWQRLGEKQQGVAPLQIFCTHLILVEKVINLAGGTETRIGKPIAGKQNINGGALRSFDKQQNLR